MAVAVCMEFVFSILFTIFAEAVVLPEFFHQIWRFCFAQRNLIISLVQFCYVVTNNLLRHVCKKDFNFLVGDRYEAFAL